MHRSTIPLAVFISCGIGLPVLPAQEASPETESFDRTVAPLLASRCLSCHNAAEQTGGLNLSNRQTAMTGGDSGTVIAPGKPNDSYLWQRIVAEEMPPKEKLSEQEQAILKEWIAGGAKWGSDPIDPFRFTTAKRAGFDWWSLQPLRKVQPPPDETGWSRNPIDNFVLAKLKEQGLSPSPTADRRTLIRRLSFELIGLPPSQKEVDRFVHDHSPDAYESLVDRLLASPRLGERWARHWLDVVRYGESQGFERDKLRSNAWRYRDWVIAAFNSDLPYDQFARLQIAGDVLQPDDASAIVATGCLVAGAYDEVGQSQQSAAMRAVVRQDELEDIVGTVGQAFLGLTVHCARCHDHKFDPIRQVEYYQMTAALGGVRHGERPILTPPVKQRIAELEARDRQLDKQLEQLTAPIIAQIQRERHGREQPTVLIPPIARWDFDGDLRDGIGELHGTAHGGAKIENGHLVLDGKEAFVSTAPLGKPLKEKTLEAWVRLENLTQRGGGVISLQTTDGVVFDAIVFGEREPKRWMPGSNSFVRTQNVGGEVETEADRQFVHIAVTYAADGTITMYRNGRPYGTAYQSNRPITFAAEKSQIVFGLRHGKSAGGNRMLAGAIDRAQLYDRALSSEEVAASFQGNNYVSPEEVAARMTPEQRSRQATWQVERRRIAEEIERLRTMKTYAVVPKPPGEMHLLIRGNTTNKGPVVAAGGIEAVNGVNADFRLPPDAAEAKRRIELADWITSPENPLFARTIVNRVWHYHFGRGLIETPNDLGFNGGVPSHPELLDYLAGELIRSGFRLKHLHRLIVTSATYRQSSLPRSECAEIDANNRLLWRMTPRRLEAESLRDAMLAVSGELNPQVGGPPYRDFKTFVFNSQFYEKIDPTEYDAHRRTIYRFWLRSGRNSLLDAFDCPDPSTTAPKRAVTTTPVQSLALLNNSFVLRMAEAMARRIEQAHGEDVAFQIEMVFQAAYQRPPTADELDRITPFAEQHGLAALCRVVFNSNEFLYVD